MLCSAEMASKPWFRWLALVAGLAFVLRLVNLAQLAGTPLATVLIGDAWQYDAWAQRIAAGDWLGSGAFYQAPLYPYLLGVVFAVAGHSLLAVRLIQAALGAASCALLSVAGRRFVGPRAGLVAGAMLALYPPAIFYDGLLQKSSLDLFLAVLLLALLGEFMAGGSAVAERRRIGAATNRWPWLAGAGLALGAFMLNRENARVLYPVVLVWLWFFFRAVPVRNRLAWLAAFTLGVAAAALPVGLRNAYVGGEFLISTSQAGPNFYIGNHAGAHGAYEALVPGRDFRSEREDATRQAETALGKRLSAGEVSDYWLGLALRDIRQAPGRWLLLLGRKLLLTFNAAEVVDTESLEVYREHSVVLDTRFTFGVILTLAAAGAWLTRRDWKRLALLYGVVGSFALSVALFYVVARYRYPIVPAILLLAGAAVAEAPAAVRARRGWVPALVIGAVAAILAYLPIVPTADETDLNLGTALISLGRASEAVPWLERAATAAPDYAAPHFNLGVAFERLGERQKSLDEFAVAARLSPNNFEAQSALALARQESGDLTGAVTAFREAARLQPENAKAQFNLANALQAAGDTADALPHYESALRLKPDYAEAHSNLALALRDSGNLPGAIEHLQAAARLQPANAAIAFNLAGMLNDAGRAGTALASFEQAERLSPDSADIQFALAQAYGRANRWQDALNTLERARAIATGAGRADAVAMIDAAIQACRKRVIGR